MRNIINKQLEQYKDKEVALLFSSGMDSLTLLLSCLDVGIRPHLYTVRMEDFVSEDVIKSRRIKDIYNLEYTEVVIPNDIEQLKTDVRYIIEKFKVKKKTQVQCIYPFLYIVNYVKEDIVLCGVCADTLYGSSRKMSELARKSEEEFAKKRKELHENPDTASYSFTRDIFVENGKIFVAPYKDNRELIDYFYSKTHKELNSPKQKNVAYEEYKKEIVEHKLYRKKSSMQVDAKIREWHDKLLETDLNVKGWKAIVGIYNHIYKQIFG